MDARRNRVGSFDRERLAVVLDGHLEVFEIERHVSDQRVGEVVAVFELDEFLQVRDGGIEGAEVVEDLPEPPVGVGRAGVVLEQFLELGGGQGELIE